MNEKNKNNGDIPKLNHEKVITPLPSQNTETPGPSPLDAELQAMAPPQQPQTAQPAQPYVPPTNPIVSSSEMPEEKEPKERNYKQWALLAGAGLILLGMLFGLLVGLKVITFGTFKTITYTNNDAKYKLQFYSKYITDKATNDEDDNGTKLISKYSRDDKAPITLYIAKSPISSGTANYDRFKNCPTKQSKIDTVYNKYLDTDIALCDLGSTSQEQKDAMYAAVAKDTSSTYFILIMQDLDFENGLKDKESAQKLLENSGMTVYRDDIKKIVGSIQPLD